MAATTALILYRGQGSGQITGIRLLPRMGAFSPSGGGVIPVPPVNYYPWPQGGERSIHSSLGPKRRAKLSKALHEATEHEEPEQPERKKRKKVAPTARKAAANAPKPREIATEARAIGEPPPAPIGREPEPTPAIEEPYVPRFERTTSGIGLLRGRRQRAKQGTFQAASGGEGVISRTRRKPRVGRLEPEGIENPTLEQIMLATAA
jgi:hypothetical protein